MSGGDVWFTTGYNHRIGKLDPLTQDVIQWEVPSGGQVLHLAVALDGRVWFTEREGDRIGVLDPITNTIKTYQLASETHPLDLAIDDDGAIWFTNERGNSIGRLELSALGTPPGPVLPGAMGIELSASATSTCADAQSHELMVSWKVTGGTSPHEVTLEISGPDGKTEVTQAASLEGTRTFELVYPGGGNVTVRNPIQRFSGGKCFWRH